MGHYLEHWCIRFQKPYPNHDQVAQPRSKTSSILESPLPDLKDSHVLPTFKIDTESFNSEHLYIKDEPLCHNHDKDANYLVGVSFQHLLKSQSSLKGHVCAMQ